MRSCYFVGPYRPIICGIADYTYFLNREMPLGKWPVLSFDLKRYGAPLNQGEPSNDAIWRGITCGREVSASVMLEGIRQFGGHPANSVLWFQHETAIWPDPERFTAMLRALRALTIVTFHTLHFQSPETPEGLRRSQRDLLRGVLPDVDAITVFTRGVRAAVASAFPEYEAKIHLIEHGVHSYPNIRRLSRKEAREKLNDFLLYESELDCETKEMLHKRGVLNDPNATVLGQTGFLCPSKQSEWLYVARDVLQRMLPGRRIAAIRIGCPRDAAQIDYADRLKPQQIDKDKYLLQVLLPEELLPVAQRAFDINVYWPQDCTQSGILAHALGVGAAVAGRDLEGVGETLKNAGQIVDTSIARLLAKMRTFILDAEASARVEETALAYAERHTWARQARKHVILANALPHRTNAWAAMSGALRTQPQQPVFPGRNGSAHGSPRPAPSLPNA